MIIYIADDEPLAVELLRRAVEEAVPQAQLETFSSARRLLSRARERAPDVVFLDIEMPGMDGITLAKELNRCKKSINLIFVTGYDQYAGEALGLFASGYILKPATADKVRVQMEHLRFAPAAHCRLQIKTDPAFAILADGRPIVFRRRKTEELLAYLVYCQGAVTDANEIRRVLFGPMDGLDIKTNSYFHHLKADLVTGLEKLGLQDILHATARQYALDPKGYECDRSGEELQAALQAVFHWK